MPDAGISNVEVVTDFASFKTDNKEVILVYQLLASGDKKTRDVYNVP